MRAREAPLSDEWSRHAKDEQMKLLLELYFGALLRFRAQYAEYKQSGGVEMSELDNWVGTAESKGPLWRLKDLCHAVLEEYDHLPRLTSEYMFDKALHLIFHDYMSFKEHIYVLDRFGDLTAKKSATGKERGSSQALAEFQKVIERVHKDIPGEIELARELFDMSAMILKHMLPKHGENAILVRYLLENEDVLRQIYGKQGAQKILAAMSGKQAGSVYWTAGSSYLASGRYDKAAEMFRRLLVIQPDSRKAKAALSRATRASAEPQRNA